MKPILHMMELTQAILTDFYIVGTRVTRLLNVYGSAVGMVGYELLQEILTFFHPARDRFLVWRKSILDTQKKPHDTIVSNWFKKIPDDHIDVFGTSPLPLVLISIGIFIFGCSWFILMVYIFG